jgi:hypothetical protein
MNPAEQKPGPSPPCRRYVVHLLCTRDADYKPWNYIVRIRPWTARVLLQAEVHERIFTDEYAMIAAINPLLPSGSDVRDIFSHIESPDGFYYILELSGEEARKLGWRG